MSSAEAYLQALLASDIYEADKLTPLRQKFENSLSGYRLIYEDSFYEEMFNAQKRKAHKNAILAAQKLGQLLLGYDDLLSAQDTAPPDLFAQYKAKIDSIYQYLKSQ